MFFSIFAILKFNNSFINGNGKINNMHDINIIIEKEFNLKQWQVINLISLKNEGATIPFIARYRKEKTGELDENIIRDVFDRYDYIEELNDRKKTIINSIEEQGKLTDELRKKIEDTLNKTELEDLYLPYKPKRRTRATIAKENGLEPLSIQIKEANYSNLDIDLTAVAATYVNPDKGINSAVDALKGAGDIIAEEISENADYRAWIRNFILMNGSFKASIKEEFPEGTTKYEIYRNYEVPVKDIKSHNMLALRRGESENTVNLSVTYDEDLILEYLYHKYIMTDKNNIIEYLKPIAKDAFNRLMKISIVSELRLLKKENADVESINVFEENLRQLLLSSPAGMKPTLGVDPGFRTGCKLAVIDNTGKFIRYENIHPFQSLGEKNHAIKIVTELIDKYDIELIAIGNGTAGRETDEFIAEVLNLIDRKPIKITVNESGASIYSASKLANEEFPDLDLTVRGAISIARRLQDPLAELVKIDPKSIGVGQYQHDVDQKLLKKKLEETVSSCVNYVGVNLNTASKELLMYVSGINEQVAKTIVQYRNSNGAFKNRKQLLKVPKLGEKKYEQSAGFLRIVNGENPLDNTAVHPESYYIAEKIAKNAQLDLNNLAKESDKLSKIDLSAFVDEKIGMPTLMDIINELAKPGRDPREEFKYAKFDTGIKEMKDLKVGMELEGVITNITNFGAFADIGVHQDGLIHISQIANRYISNPAEAVKVGQIVKVKVLEVNIDLKRINLTMKLGNNQEKSKHKDKHNAEPAATLQDLKNRFK